MISLNITGPATVSDASVLLLFNGSNTAWNDSYKVYDPILNLEPASRIDFRKGISEIISFLERKEKEEGNRYKKVRYGAFDAGDGTGFIIISAVDLDKLGVTRPSNDSIKSGGENSARQDGVPVVPQLQH